MLGAPGSVRAVHFSARPAVVVKHLGVLCLPLALLTAVPAVVSALSGRLDVGLRYLLVISLLLAFGIPASRLRVAKGMQTNEALCITALVFVLSPLLMCFPILAYGVAFEDALFEAISGVTTTGLSTLPSLETLPPAFLFSRAWMQWVGGLGVVVLALALIMDSGPAANQLGFDRREREDIAGSTRGHARRILIIYLILTASGVAALLACGLTPLDAIAQAMAAVSTGGFATREGSLAGFESVLARAVVLGICIAGALSFGWYYRGYFHRPLAMLRDERLLVLLGAMFFCAAGLLWVGDDAVSLKSVGHALAMAVSAQTTAGFSTVEVTQADAQLVMIGSMLMGGEVGSTAGGVKVLRVLILLRLLQLVLVRAAVPAGTHLRIRVAGERVTPREVEMALAVICGYLLVIAASWLVFLGHGAPAMPALFDVVSATTTTGLTSGLTGESLATPLKAVLAVCMLMGRVETIALIVLLYPRTWFGMRRKSK